MFGYDDEREWYDLQQVCLGGHIITSFGESKPNSRRARCPQCGEATIVACPSCKERIKGYHHVPGIPYMASSFPDRFCDACGTAMPWVARDVEAIMEIAALSDAVTESDHERLRADLKALIVPSAQVEVAALRLRKIMARMEDIESAALTRALGNAATTAAKVALGIPAERPASKRSR